MRMHEPVARPSRPSARFTALLKPVTMNQMSRIASDGGSANRS